MKNLSRVPVATKLGKTVKTVPAIAPAQTPHFSEVSVNETGAVSRISVVAVVSMGFVVWGV